ncbi:kinase-like domain-containing protein [Lasiosphaeria hispida]|uniref:Kinase-like domain-containing protein n=1 Tax=Lasiosphaeria hispida TaxID=260671 RepID=A0AAJ0HWT0_9PEZI|nr:kinase-like domain-containing protein [Lasiosphaeria hispida]
MMAPDASIKMSTLELTIHKRRVPFAEGALRLAFHARTSASTNSYVVKSFKQQDERFPLLVEDMRVQALCRAFAFEFSGLLGGENKIDFPATACFKCKSAEGDAACISLETFLEGTYIKYNGNAGFVEDRHEGSANQAAQAFSHFTFERSQGRFLVCDLQGAGEFLTDPVIHTADPDCFKLSETNLGTEGIKLFFVSHECNDLCGRLGLRSNQEMVKLCIYTFRDTWPAILDAVRCSNKLCGRILQRAEAKVSDTFPGYHWCDTCLPQLQAFTISQACDLPGASHRFEVSRFFYESQGQKAPRRCPQHRED